MAIDFAKGIATTVVNTGLRKVAGNLPGLLGKIKGKQGVRDSSDLKDLENAKVSGVSPKLLQFPSDIDSDPGVGNHGHYIIFFINEFEKSTMKFSEFVPDEGKQNLKKAEQEMGLSGKLNQTKMQGGKPVSIPEAQLTNQGGSVQYDSKNFVTMERLNNQFKDDTVIQKRPGYGYAQINHNYISNNTGNSDKKTNANEELTDQTKAIKNKMKENVRIEMPSRKRLDTAIALYMPASVAVTYGAKYTEPEISPMAGAIGQAVGDMSGGMSLVDTYEKILPKVTDGLQQAALKMGTAVLDGIGITGVREAIEIGRAEVIADRMQLAFKGVDRRSFQYTFKMTPKNAREADEIKKIVAAFKINMMPEYKEGKRDTLNYPATFDIEYHYKGKRNDYLNRVSECFLENVQVQYGGDRYKTFDPHNSEGAPPVETSVTLAFKEIEIMHREKIKDGF
tara:strand:- start:1032 stop:2381 length:1350 start_codon:yes stop_codon:yes gene_type:complete